MFRKAILLPMIAAAIGVPYLLNEDGWRTALLNKWNTFTASAPNASASNGYIGIGGPTTQVGSLANTSTPAPAVVLDMITVLQFGREDDWVTSNWPHVSIFDAEEGLRGMRVPLVTGMRPYDLVGALTYYFDENQKMQRITFRGTTNDPRRLVELLTSKFHLRREKTLGTTLYVSEWHDDPLSLLQVTPPSVLNTGGSGSKHDVSFELNWPTKGRGMSDASRDVVRRQTS